jgi:hypothetical protein
MSVVDTINDKCTNVGFMDHLAGLELALATAKELQVHTS